MFLIKEWKFIFISFNLSSLWTIWTSFIGSSDLADDISQGEQPQQIHIPCFS